jgi:antirestriction protein ArdC
LTPGTGVTAEPREDHAHYLKSWIAVLKADSRAIFSADSAAQKAADYLMGLQPS